MIGCLVLAFALCQAGYAGGGYVQPAYYPQQPQVVYAQPAPVYYVAQPVYYAQPIAQPYYGGGYGYGGGPSISLNFGGQGYRGGYYNAGHRRCC
jgi:hypothetical protein